MAGVTARRTATHGLERFPARCEKATNQGIRSPASSTPLDLPWNAASADAPPDRSGTEHRNRPASTALSAHVPAPEEVAVPRYFLHVREAGDLVEDPDGTDFPDEAAVRKEAIEAAREIMAEHIRKGLDVSSWSFEVVDEDGRLIMSVPFSEAVQRVDA